MKDVKTVKSGGSGDFVIDGLDSGTYNIVFDAKGYSTGVKYSVEVKPNETVDLGSRLILQTDRGTQVIVQGSVFFKDGTSVTGAEVKVERVNSDGSTKKIVDGYDQYLQASLPSASPRAPPNSA